MAGITIQKNYISSNATTVSLANNWTVLVLGVTSRGPTTPTLIQSYNNEFLPTFGQPVSGVLTHPYVRFLLENNVPVLFKRIINNADLTTATTTVTNSTNNDLFTILATDNYIGEIGNNIYVQFKTDSVSKSLSMIVAYSDSEEKLAENTDLTTIPNFEIYDLGIVTTNNESDLLYQFVNNAVRFNQFNSKYIKFDEKTVDPNIEDWKNIAILSNQTITQLENGAGGEALTLDQAVAVLQDQKSLFWKDKRLNYAPTYYPQLRFITTGGIISNTAAGQDGVNISLGKFATDCQSSFRVLIDYPLHTKNIETVVRNFATTLISTKTIDTSLYAYFGNWGTDSRNNILPGSAGFLSALGRSGYNVYSRRIAGSSYNPGFTKAYDEMYIDSINNWQAENMVQLNPIVNIDAIGNLAVMGSSTLAMPPAPLGSKNPAQALDVVLVGDYVAAILNGIALSAIEGVISRLSLNMLSTLMSAEIEKFVTSGAITKFELNFNIEELGKLNIECVLYFPIGLEEVALTVTSVYDTEII